MRKSFPLGVSSAAQGKLLQTVAQLATIRKRNCCQRCEKEKKKKEAGDKKEPAN